MTSADTKNTVNWFIYKLELGRVSVISSEQDTLSQIIAHLAILR
jgi:hypothetical protein